MFHVVHYHVDAPLELVTLLDCDCVNAHRFDAMGGAEGGVNKPRNSMSQTIQCSEEKRRMTGGFLGGKGQGSGETGSC